MIGARHFLIVTVGICLCAQHAEAYTGWRLTLFGGQFLDNELPQLLFEGELILDPNFDDSYIVTISIAKEFARLGKFVAWEVEGQVGKHSGLQEHWEFTAALVIRWLYFPWDTYLDTSFAIGDGVSYATEVPTLEAKFIGRSSQHALNYLLSEFDFTLPQLPHWSLVARIHHRSDIFGLFGGREGSNFAGFGIRYRF